MNILHAGFYSALGTASRLVASLVLIKLVASFAGPEGVGKLGQFISLMSVMAVLAGGGISSGIVKYVAEYRNDAQRLARLLSSALGYLLCASCLMGVALLLLSRSIAGWLLDDTRYASLIQILAIAQLAIALCNYMLAMINGFMDVRRLAFIQVLGSVLSIVMALWLSYWLHLYGAMLALIAGQALCLFVAFPAWLRSPYFQLSLIVPRFDREMTLRLAAFSAMTLTSAMLAPVVNIAVRDHLAVQFGWQQVGYWQAVSKVSDAYLLFLTTAINIYYLPKLAQTHERADLLLELRKAYRYLLPAVVVLAVLIYALRDWLTALLFSADFASADSLYAPQLAGDVIKIASFVLSYLMLAKAMTRLFIISECIFSAIYLVLVYLFTARYGLIGAMYAFAFNYILYLAFNVFVAKRYLARL